MNKIRHISLTIILSVFAFSSAFSQIQLVSPTMTPAQAVENILLGAGVQATNITFNGSAAAATQVQSSVKHFNNGTTNFPIDEGVLLRTNTAPSVNNDPDLVAIGGNVTNGVVLEFDFIPDGNLLSFNYIFSSAEYSSFTCSNYNDVFGFFISGPGISGPFTNNAANIATIPGSTTPVGINTVNSGSASGGYAGSTCAAANPNWQSDSQYWTNAYNTMYGNGLGFNGSTVVLSAESGLQCGETYHIKMAISNVGDQGFDSGVFLEANSFSAAGVSINIEASTSVSDTVLIAGCTEGIVHFTRPSFMTDNEQSVTFHTSGTLTQGEDYPFLAGGDSTVTFEVGQDSISLIIAPYPNDDGMDPHLITINAYSVNDCGDTVFSTGSIWVINEPYHEVASNDTLLRCFSDSIPLWANTTGQFDLSPFTYTWKLLDGNGDTLHTGLPYIASAFENDTVYYLVTSTDQCGFDYVDTSMVIMNQTLSIDTLIQYQADCGMDNGAVVAQVSGYSTSPAPLYDWTNISPHDTTGAIGQHVNSSAWPDRSAGWYYFTITDKWCSVNDSVLVEQTPPPTASFEADPEAGFSPLDVNFTNTSEPAETYEWDFGNGEPIVTVNDLSSQSTTYYEEGSYTVTLTLTEGECTDVATKIITVETYLPIDYESPNVFSPNGNGGNDVFKLISYENAASVEVVILNRWGNVVFESNDLDFGWNGKVKNTGADCTEGVYFYKAIFKDFYGEEFVDSGFVHLFR